MKVRKSYMYSAIVQTVLHFYSTQDLAEAVLDELNKTEDRAELQTVRNDGFVIRRKKDSAVTTETTASATAAALAQLLDDAGDEACEYIADQYEFQYDPCEVTDELVNEIFQFNASGRLIYAEMDLV